MYSVCSYFADAPPPPADVTLTNVQFDRISLEWSAILSADFYRITVSPTPSSGDCSSGTCTFSSLNATIGHLPLAMIMIGVSSVNCAGQGNSTVRVENTIPEGIYHEQLLFFFFVVFLKELLFWITKQISNVFSLSSFCGISTQRQSHSFNCN